jgi:uncharacterized protein (DUF433 family)
VTERHPRLRSPVFSSGSSYTFLKNYEDLAGVGYEGLPTHSCRLQANGALPGMRGLRMPVARVVSVMAEGMSHAEITAAYRDLEEEDIWEALRYAAAAVRGRELPVSELS